ncbi:hypothetical protein KC19_10G038500, partial [Ceratodon purpureus]
LIYSQKWTHIQLGRIDHFLRLRASRKDSSTNAHCRHSILELEHRRHGRTSGTISLLRLPPNSTRRIRNGASARLSPGVMVPQLQIVHQTYQNSHLVACDECGWSQFTRN